MRIKNFKSAIHNFTHSFASVDYTHSGKLAVNVIINLHNRGIEAKATFDILNNEIKPVEAISERSKKLLHDYCGWLPNHLLNHECDITKLETLQISIWADFKSAFSPNNMENTRQYELYAQAKWKLIEKNQQVTNISQTELINIDYLQSQIPEID